MIRRMAVNSDRHPIMRPVGTWTRVLPVSARLMAAVVLAGTLAAGCDREVAPPQITCDKLRALKVGLPIDSVRRLLGPPPSESRRSEHVTFGGNGDTYWSWDSPSSGVRLHLYFLDGRLTEASSYIRTMARDLFDTESRPTLFALKADGTWSEGADFRRIYCP
jgi:hypothetical protein